MYCTTIGLDRTFECEVSFFFRCKRMKYKLKLNISLSFISSNLFGTSKPLNKLSGYDEKRFTFRIRVARCLIAY